MDAKTLAAEFATLTTRLDTIQEVTDPERIAKTTDELGRLGYTPMLVVAPSDFLDASLEDIRAEVERIRTMPAAELPSAGEDADAVRVQAALLLVSAYEQLTLLRRPDPKTWDDVVELYGED